MEYLKAWVFAHRAKPKNNLSEVDMKVIEELDKLIKNIENLMNTGFVKRTPSGNFELAELAEAQTQIKISQEKIDLYEHFMRGFLSRPEAGACCMNVKGESFTFWKDHANDVYCVQGPEGTWGFTCFGDVFGAILQSLKDIK